MSTVEIPRSEWVTFFDRFSQRRQWWPVTIEMLDPELGNQLRVRSLPLAGITAELRDNGRDEIELMASARERVHFSHTITSPTRVWIKVDACEGNETLEIESGRRAVLLRFCPTERPVTSNNLYE